MTLKTIALTFLALSLAYGADEKPKTSKETQAAIDKAIDGNLISANKAYVAFRFELEKAQDKILKDLEKLKITATKAGDLDSAIAIDAQIKSVKEKGMLADRVAESGGELLGDVKGDISTLNGTWTVTYKGADIRVLVVSNGKAYFKDNTAYTYQIKYDSRNDVFYGKPSPNKFETYKLNGDSLTICHWTLYTEITMPKVPHSHDAIGKKN